MHRNTFAFLINHYKSLVKTIVFWKLNFRIYIFLTSFACIIFRDPKASCRPDFTEVSTQLSVSNSKLIHWSQEDKSEFPEASKLGGSLACAEKLYKDLQQKYKSISHIKTQPTASNCKGL